MIRITFLGTSAAAPTIARGLPAIAVKREGDLMLFDCGEGTQRQMMRYGTGFDVKDVFFTHLHADHFLGIIGFVRTLAMAERSDPMHLFCPVSTGRVLDQAIRLGIQDSRTFPVDIRELKDGEAVQRDGYEVRAFAVQHKRPALGYVLSEPARPGRFDVEAARALGIPEGPLFGRLQKGFPITQDDGRIIRPEQVVGGARKGRKLVISGDTIPCQATTDASKDADILIHEATFGDDDTARAQVTFHSTARQAAEIALRANVRRLVLTHLSSRYAAEPAILFRQAKDALSSCLTDSDAALEGSERGESAAKAPRIQLDVARDGMVIDLKYSDEAAETSPAQQAAAENEESLPAEEAPQNSL